MARYVRTQVVKFDLLNARHVIKQLHEESVDPLVAMLLRTRDQIDQSRKGPFIVQQLVSCLV